MLKTGPLQCPTHLNGGWECESCEATHWPVLVRDFVVWVTESVVWVMESAVLETGSDGGVKGCVGGVKDSF